MVAFRKGGLIIRPIYSVIHYKLSDEKCHSDSVYISHFENQTPVAIAHCELPAVARLLRI
jgi:GT2 family glycosyltransferase